MTTRTDLGAAAPRSRRGLVGPLGLALGTALVGLVGCLDPGFEVVDLDVAEDLRAVAAIGGAVLAAGDGGRVVGFDLDGRRVDTSTTARLRGRIVDLGAISGGPGDLVVVAGSGGVILEQAPGTPWVRAAAPTQARLGALLRPSPSTLLAAGDGGTLLERRGSGWARVELRGVTLAPGERIAGGWAQGSEAVLVTDRGQILERDGGRWRLGATATATVATGTTSASRPVPLFAAWSSTVAGDRWVVGGQGAVLRRAAGATAWRRVDSGTDEDLYAVTGGADGAQVLAVGARGTVVEGGREGFERVDPGIGRDLYAVTRVGDRVVAVGAGGTWVER